MYNVMLVDDDYPVIELLSETIPWEEMGLRLMGSYDNGLSAWEFAKTQPPDILITDIGMPRMNGLELSGRIREVKPDVRIAILSCHSEFHYAQQAMRLSIQDYLLKETLDPDELARLLLRFKQAMDEEAEQGWEKSRMRHLASEVQELRREQRMKDFVQQPLLSPEKWRHELSEFGVLRGNDHCLPVIGYLEELRQIKQRFASEQTLHFALGNVLREVLGSLKPEAVHIRYDARCSLLLFSYRPGLRHNVYDEVAVCLRQVQSTFYRILKIRMSFIIGTGCDSPQSLKLGLGELLGSEHQRFYMEPGAIEKIKPKQAGTEMGSASVLYDCYEQASRELLEMLLGKAEPVDEDPADRWISRIREAEYAPEAVKDWLLKLMLDLKLKLRLHLLPSMPQAYAADTLHKEMMDMDALSELHVWLKAYLASTAREAGRGWGGSRRTEVAEACRYVSLRLDQRISLDEVAGFLHLNPSYFSRMFRKETGITFIEYVTRMKMERAKEQLLRTDHTVGEICESLGYDNVSHFTKTFNFQKRGSTPPSLDGIRF
ncbi:MULTISPECIES: response regulator transcription factor [Paenibacillus]|uniref:response regulator transcription factor n=1 Tax=Paenibacillus TaxID=44249 RepID=UPI00048D24F0|nr:response regulator [Paenibacillus sp. IHBB 10380]